jgi:hypothetical protein
VRTSETTYEHTDKAGVADQAPLCGPCQDERGRWLDYRLPPALGIAHGSGAPYDVSAAGVRDRQAARSAEWRDTVRFQRDLIARQCRAGQHAAAPAEPAEPVIDIQLPLFHLEEAA